MSETKQPVEAAGELGGLISKLGSLFFKGLDGIFDRAAEYQEEYGVLKQVTRINAVNEETDKKYTLTIKLSPVKDKQDLFYVEAEIDPSDISVDSINKTVVKLNTDTKVKFNNMINKFLTDNNLTVTESEENTDAEDESDDDEEELDSEDKDFSERLAELVDIVNEDLRSNRLYAKYEPSNDENKDGEQSDINNERIEIVTELSIVDEGKHIKVTITPYIDNDEATPSHSENINSVDTRGDLIKLKDLKTAVKLVLTDYLEENNLKTNITMSSVLSSTSVKATFVKSSKTNRVELRAISASTDLTEAMNAIYDVTNDNDFIGLLTDEPQSFEIVDVGDGYDVNSIDGFDTCCVVRSFN